MAMISKNAIYETIIISLEKKNGESCFGDSGILLRTCPHKISHT